MRTVIYVPWTTPRDIEATDQEEDLTCPKIERAVEEATERAKKTLKKEIRANVREMEKEIDAM
jgi:hypothetical protein